MRLNHWWCKLKVSFKGRFLCKFDQGFILDGLSLSFLDCFNIQVMIHIIHTSNQNITPRHLKHRNAGESVPYQAYLKRRLWTTFGGSSGYFLGPGCWSSFMYKVHSPDSHKFNSYSQRKQFCVPWLLHLSLSFSLSLLAISLT